MELETISIGNEKFEVLVEGERYRVCNISTFEGITKDNKSLIRNNPLSYGLAVEQKLSNDSYYVVCFVKWDQKNHKSYVKDVDGRSLDTIQQLLDDFTDPNDIVLFLNEYFNCLDFAKQALKDIWEGTEMK